jgi:8-oxo-dGTP diphosphatase
MKRVKNFENPAATASLIIVKNNQILLVKRKHEPFAGMWALPGGFLNCDKESLEQAAIRELKEETSLIIHNESDLILLYVQSKPNRDPRGHVIDHVFVPRIFIGTPAANDDAAEVKYFSFDELPQLAFDHLESINNYRELVRLWDIMLYVR